MNTLTTTTGGDTGSLVLGGVFWVGAIIAYWVPTIVASVRHVTNTGSVAVVNAFLGWTVIGWIIALAMACRSRPPVEVSR